MEAPAQRYFLGWDRPALESAAMLLLRHAPDGDLWRHLVVLPGGRASRLLLGMLLERAGDGRSATMFAPPRFCTPGELADVLLPPVEAGQQPAGPLLRRLAWVGALRAMPRAELEPLVPHAPAGGDQQAWWHIATALEQAHDELTRELILFEEVPQRAERAEGLRGSFPDSERWAAAAQVQRRYEAVLEAAGLFDHGLRMLRLVRGASSAEAGRAAEAREIDHIVLIGAADLSRSARQLLEQAARHGQTRLTSLVFAPESLQERFDELGTVVPERWADAKLELPDILFAEGPADQAARVLESIAGLGGKYAPHEIIIGAPDEEVVPHIERQAEQALVIEERTDESATTGREREVTLRVRPAMGTPTARTMPLRLLAEVGAFLKARSFSAFASLVRHPDVERWLVQRLSGEGGSAEWWLDVLDCYQAEHVPGRVDGVWYASEPIRRVLDALYQGVCELLGGLDDQPEERALDQWAEPIRAFMARVYGAMVLSRNDPGQRRVIAGNIAVREALSEIERSGQTGGSPALCPDCSAHEAIDMLLEFAGSGAVPEEGDEDHIEVLGWLELPLDPAPAAIITGLNDGQVPANTTGDAFLPDVLREALGMSSNRRRFARDLYILASIVSSRPNAVLIAGRRAADNTPLAPSRLLFACSADEVVNRVRLYTGQRPDSPRVRIARHSGPGETNLFKEMPNVPAAPVTSMRVTSFRTFLRSPYEFYLRDVLGLEEVDDHALELDPLAYGDLLHKVLDRFGRSEARHSDDEQEIETCLLDHLQTLARDRFGSDPSTCIWLQLQFAQRRLREFARFQAERRKAGWLIEAVEWSPPGGPAPFVVDGEPFGLRGKIDRIDRHESGNRWAVLDYKTGDSVDKPATAHRGRAGWRDLQLPLYRHLVAPLELPSEPSQLVLGYIALPKAPGGVDLLAAEWTADELEEADEVAREVVRKVRSGEFHDPGDRPPEDGILSAICGVGFIGSARRSRDDEGGDA